MAQKRGVEEPVGELVPSRGQVLQTAVAKPTLEVDLIDPSEPAQQQQARVAQEVLEAAAAAQEAQQPASRHPEWMAETAAPELPQQVVVVAAAVAPKAARASTIRECLTFPCPPVPKVCR